MSTKNKREELVHWLLGQITVILFVIIGSWIYTIPKYIALSDSIDKTNDLIWEYQSINMEGIPYLKLDGILSSKWKVELLSIIQSAPKETQAVIKKVWWDPYLTWLTNEINKSSTDETKLKVKKARLNSILPTLNPISNNVIQETITLKKYTTFVEEKLLKEFWIESTAPIGIQGIHYGKKWSNMPETIGSFDMDITFKTTNAEIIRMIEYINWLGKYDLLNDTSVTSSWGTPAVMSNPLAMIDSLSLESSLDQSKPNDKNSGNMLIRFFIRGSSPTDVAFLSENVKSRKEALGKKISTTLDACIGELTCPRKKDLEAVSRKFTEFNRATENIKYSPWTETYWYSSELESILAIENEFKKITR